MTSGATTRRLHVGTAYYPEQWPIERWPADIQLIRESGFNVVRMTEVAWSAMEPAAGCVDVEWLEEAITMLAEAGISTVLGTPTAAPPVWLVQAHPDLLAVDAGVSGCSLETVTITASRHRIFTQRLVGSRARWASTSVTIRRSLDGSSTTSTSASAIATGAGGSFSPTARPVRFA